MSKAKIGRNDPCPCGSGKKFKNCCIDLNYGTGGDLFSRYSQTITEIKLKLEAIYQREIKKISSDLEQRFLSYSTEDNLKTDHESLFSDWLWFDMTDNSGLTLAQDYWQAHADYMPQPLKECLQALSQSYLSVYEAIDSRDTRLVVRDLFTGQEYSIILKETFAADLNANPLLLLGRLVALTEGNVFSGMVLIIPNNDGQAEYLSSHFSYLQKLIPGSTTELLKANADLLYGLFDHCQHKRHIHINDIRTFKLDTAQRLSLQNELAASDRLTFVHDIEDVCWYEDILNPAPYKRIGLGEDYAVTFVSTLADLDNWDGIGGDYFPGLKDWPLVNSRFLRKAPPPEYLEIWYNAVRDQETERWLHTPHHELDDKTPLELLQEENGGQQVLELLDRFSDRLEGVREGRSLLDYMRQRIIELIE
ncbi:SEC-C motif [Syntrophomonas zehnderi OL-4]|uniref:SEC-C motif n=1 Tax=Syntrophomonas zehnderi OL-4 TaxID=690567 RepID=A0A0E4GEA3_9FIRM|nr:MbcA/ParS/Xre antitoxin family protein [Syntrophomonas zehnderi]CFX81585.1 SEC-C motif [Syntrophomonas zehnderi OL-4]